MVVVAIIAVLVAGVETQSRFSNYKIRKNVFVRTLTLTTKNTKINPQKTY